MEKEIVLPRLINNAYVKAHPEIIFLFGHDVMGKGCFGQASILGYENTIPIHVMYKFCASSARFFSDTDGECKRILAYDLTTIPMDGRPIIPLRKMGEGCSRFKELAPILFKSMQEQIKAITYKNYCWDYGTTYGIQY